MSRSSNVSKREERALHAIVAALEEQRKEAVRLDEGMLGYILAMAGQEARQAANKAITRA
jgi:hypothetical protein